MKKILFAAFCILALCSPLLLVSVETAMAGNAAYSVLEYWAVTPATVDGNWTSANEWTDAPKINMSATAVGKYKMDYDTFSCQWIIEVFDDNTNDAGDIWQICLDDSNGGGTAPQAGDFKIEITGHTTLKAYQGNGAGWTEIADPSEVSWANSISASPLNSTPHWIVEISDVKTGGSITVANAPPTGMRLAAYDASKATWHAWAPGSADVPDQWGLIPTYSQDPWPEAFNIVFVALLSTVAVAVGFYWLRKRPKTERYSLAKNTL